MKRPQQLGQLIGERTFTFRKDGTEREVIARLGLPVQPDGEEWWCPTQVTGVGSGEVKAIAGGDAIHSILLALRFLQTTIPADAEKEGGTVEGLPDHNPIWDEKLSEKHFFSWITTVMGDVDALAATLEDVPDSSVREALAKLQQTLSEYRDVDPRPSDSTISSAQEAAAFARAKITYFKLRAKYEEPDA